MHNDEKILVEIAAYCDPDLLTTVKSAIIQADNPDRVFFAICYQSDELDDYNELKKIKNCKLKYLKKSEAKGPCYARHLCQQMIEDEKYVFQIDSHIRFTKHWDTKMIDLLLSIDDPKATISFYPPSLKEEMEKLPIDDKFYDAPSLDTPIVNYVKGFYSPDCDILSFISSRTVPISGHNYAKGPFIAAGNFFSFAEIHKKILHDTEMYYSGDELPMSIRYFTNGWNNYCTSECYIYHKYHRKNRVTPANGSALMKKEQKRLSELMHPESYNLGEYGLGKERTLEQFEEYAGVDFDKKLLYMNAETGQFENESLRKKVSFIRRKSSKAYLNMTKKELFEVIVIDPFGEYEKCIKTCLDNATKNEIQFIIGTIKDANLDQNTLTEKHIKKIIHFEKNDASYSKILAELINQLGDSYALIIDSGIQFMSDWDKELGNTIKICGDDAALTSWVWHTPTNKQNVKLVPYLNAQKEFKEFNNYLPVLKQKDSTTFRNLKFPYLTPFISDGLLFCHSKVIKSIKPDPKLNYKEQKYIYSARLWTSGINIYYPKSSFFYRIIDEKLLDEDKNNYDVICGLMGRNNNDGKQLEDNYQYTLGTKRPLWGWYNFIGYDYNEDSELIL